MSAMHDPNKYHEYLRILKEHFQTVIADGKPLFTTNVENLFETFLSNLPSEVQQHYSCNACRRFVNRYGGLVFITDTGEVCSALWDETLIPEFYSHPVKSVKEKVLESRVNGVFVSDIEVLGQPVTGDWQHMSAVWPRDRINTSRLRNADQTMAERRQDFITLLAGLREYPAEAVAKAVTLLQSEALYRSERCLGVAEWLQQLHAKRAGVKNSRQSENLVWLAVATAPIGYCHVRSSMVGTLLDDIVAGLSSEEIAGRFAAKMNPANYMRAQTAPTQGNINQAEQLVAKLGLADSLRRRYVRFEEIPALLWQDVFVEPDKPAEDRVFGSIAAKAKGVTYGEREPLNLPGAVMTWEKFQRTILPSAEKIEVMVDNPQRLMALVTAAVEDAPKILQWDNPFSWYYHGGIDGEMKRRVERAGGRYENNEIRCSLLWEGYTDLDLHCTTAHGDHIFFAHKQDKFGGWLDVDANGGMPTTQEPVENIRWATTAPIGQYWFYVHNYQERGSGTTPYRAELEINGKVYSYHGLAGGTGYRQDLFTFEYRKGQQPTISTGGGTTVEASWNVQPSTFVKVTGIVDSPNLWGEAKAPHSGTHIFFLLEECRDLSKGKGRGFFAETLISELHEIRKTLEAYSAQTPVEGAEEASACGVGYSKDQEWNLTLKITSGGSTRIIRIDRWD